MDKDGVAMMREVGNGGRTGGGQKNNKTTRKGSFSHTLALTAPSVSAAAAAKLAGSGRSCCPAIPFAGTAPHGGKLYSSVNWCPKAEKESFTPQRPAR